MDLVIGAPRLPRPGETITASEFRTIPGGKGANQAAAAARLGAAVGLVGCVGADGFGRTLRGGLHEQGVDVSGVLELDDVATGIALIVVEPGGENRILLVP